MAFAGGVFNLVAGNPVVTGTTISSTWANNTLSDIAANGLSLCVLKDGSQTITANIPMNSFKFTGLAAGSANGDSVRYQQFFPTFNTIGPVNETKTTVASATTPDIWTSVGNVVDYTGTTTATGFAAAPQAGSRRTLVCAAAAPFTAGANLLIQGYASGNTYTAAAGDLINVVAITTTQFRLTIAPASGAPVIGTSLPRGQIAGLKMSTAGGSSTMTIGAGQAVDSTNAALMNLSASIGKTTSAWAVGSGNGGLDTGTIANNTWYAFHEIMRPDTVVVDVIFSLSATSPTMPSNYTYFRRIGWGLTDGSAHWVGFIQNGDDFQWLTGVGDVSGGTLSTASRTSITISAPPNTFAKCAIDVAANTGTTIAVVTDLSETDNAASAANMTVYCSVSAASINRVGVPFVCKTDSSRNVGVRGSSASAYDLCTRGWIDPRGRAD